MNKSHLLIHEPPLQVLPSLAVSIGLNESIVLQQLHYWLNNPKTGVDRDGFRWVYNTYEEWLENFPFWSISTIQRTFASLEKLGLVVSEQLDKKKHDMKKFYRIDYTNLEKMDHVNLTSSKTPKGNDVKRYSETTTETTKDSSVDTDSFAELNPDIAARHAPPAPPRKGTLSALQNGENENEQIIMALYLITGREYSPHAKTNGGQKQSDIMQKLRGKKITREQITKFGEWWRVTHSWQKPISKPTLYQVWESWNTAMDWDRTSDIKSPNDDAMPADQYVPGMFSSRL